LSAGVSEEAVDIETTFFEDSQVIDTPSILGIVSQTLRRAPGGQNVVDLVLEIDSNGIGVDQFEFRVTKT